MELEIETEMKAWIGMIAMAMLVAAGSSFGQDTSCVNRLIPCLNYLNGSGDPPESCCNPLRSVIDSNPDCLCNLITKEGSNRAEQAGVDINQAQQLPARCGQHLNPLSCLALTNAGSRDGVFNFAAATMSSSTLQVTTMMVIISAILRF